MDLRSLSASSAEVFANCESRWRAEYEQRANQPAGAPALKGTVCHDVLERWVKDHGYHLKSPADPEAAMRALYEQVYWTHFGDASEYEDGLEMCLRWLDRTDWHGRTVISTEVKKNFKLATSVGEVPFNFIMDRVDRLDDGEVEVVDYKTWRVPLQPIELKNKIQVRCYALAAQMEFPDAKRVWVTLDQLRYDPVGVSFTKDENRATYRYLRALAERIIASNGETESINLDCRYCIRKTECKTLMQHIKSEGPIGRLTPEAAAEKRLALEGAFKALNSMLGELDDILLDHMRDEDLLEMETDAVKVSIKMSARRTFDAAYVAGVLGPELMSQHPKGLTLGVLQTMLKTPGVLTSDQASAIKQAIKTEFGSPGVKVKPKVQL